MEKKAGSLPTHITHTTDEKISPRAEATYAASGENVLTFDPHNFFLAATPEHVNEN